MPSLRVLRCPKSDVDNIHFSINRHRRECPYTPRPPPLSHSQASRPARPPLTSPRGTRCSIFPSMRITPSNAARVPFRSGSNFGLSLIDLCKKLSYIVKEEIGLFQSREMPSFRHLRVLHNIISLLNPAQRRGVNLLRKIRVREGSL